MNKAYHNPWSPAWNRLLAICVFALQATSLFAQDQPYQLGLGKSLNDWLTVGGYFSTEYVKSDTTNEFLVDDLALLIYGENRNGFSYLLELESVEPVKVDFANDTSGSNFPPTIERLYFDYKHSDNLAIRVGKQITPIGYWNLQPINVLRETTSNPLYSKEMFPKFLTGVDVHGFTPGSRNLSYHVFFQNNRDMDANNINIAIDQHYGAVLNKVLDNGWQFGGSVGNYREPGNGDTRYLQLNARYDTYRFSFISEMATRITDQPAGGSVHGESFYSQLEYRFTPQHALIGRFEHSDNAVFDPARRNIGIVGYSYRPLYPVSLKIEHQWHNDSAANAIMASFSVLF